MVGHGCFFSEFKIRTQLLYANLDDNGRVFKNCCKMGNHLPVNFMDDGKLICYKWYGKIINAF